MLLLRIVGVLVAITIGAGIVAFLFTRDRRYLRLSWQVAKYAGTVRPAGAGADVPRAGDRTCSKPSAAELDQPFQRLLQRRTLRQCFRQTLQIRLGRAPTAGEITLFLCCSAAWFGCTLTCISVTSAPSQREFVDQARQHLSQLGGDRAGIGVDNNLPRLEIGHAARRGQIGRRDLLENALQFDQPPGMRRQSRQIAGGIQVSVERTRCHLIGIG
jgi:hypothetical protein